MPTDNETKTPAVSAVCPRCQVRGKDWNGGDPVCFLSGDNWKCATVDALREICEMDYVYCEDQKYATLNIAGCEQPNGDRIGYALWVTWYKNRGRTDAMWILSDDSPPRVPTIDELEIIIRSF